jgi:hypothetical protein
MRLLFIILMLMLSGSGFSQQGAASSGGNSTGSGGSISYTLGQVLYTTSYGSGGSSEQGVQQTYEISVITGLEIAGISLDLQVYPNPASESLKLIIRNHEIKKFRFQLYNNNGVLLLDSKLYDVETDIVMASFSPGLYILKVEEDKKVLKTFKIIKK